MVTISKFGEAEMSISKKRTVLVTGGGRGIGKAIVLAFAETGANVVIVDIDQAIIDECAAEAAALGAQTKAISADCGDPQAIDAMIAETVSAFGGLDVLVNNAATTSHTGVMETTEAEYDRINRLNAKGAFFCLQRAAAVMIERGGGRIVNISSIAGRGYAGNTNAAYAASKGAVIALTRSAAHQLGMHNITVNAICPGITLTPLLLEVFQAQADEAGVPLEAKLQELAAPIPIKRTNDPADIAAMAVFLGSDGARNITGQTINVDGGLMMN